MNLGLCLCPGLPCAEGSRAGCRTQGGLSRAGQRGRIPPLALCPRCWGCSPGHGWPAGLPAHSDGSCPAFHPPAPSSHALPSMLNAVFLKQSSCPSNCFSPRHRPPSTSLLKPENPAGEESPLTTCATPSLLFAVPQRWGTLSARGGLDTSCSQETHLCPRTLLQTCSASSRLSITHGWEPCSYRAALHPNPGTTEDEIPTSALC